MMPAKHVALSLFRGPTPADNQPTVRMTRDTVDGTVVLHICDGGTVTRPDVGERRMSAMVVNQNHHAFGEATPATCGLTAEGSMRFAFLLLRPCVDAAEPDDRALAPGRPGLAHHRLCPWHVCHRLDARPRHGLRGMIC